jgi:hypothetical protein
MSEWSYQLLGVLRWAILSLSIAVAGRAIGDIGANSVRAQAEAQLAVLKIMQEMQQCPKTEKM